MLKASSEGCTTAGEVFGRITTKQSSGIGSLLHKAIPSHRIISDGCTQTGEVFGRTTTKQSSGIGSRLNRVMQVLKATSEGCTHAGMAFRRTMFSRICGLLLEKPIVRRIHSNPSSLK